jgi:hypothetical protein
MSPVMNGLLFHVVPPPVAFGVGGNSAGLTPISA